MHTTNQSSSLGAVEAWTIVNDNVFGHGFHIHDVQFKIVARSDGPSPDHEQGWKDTLYIPRSTSVTFIAKFDEFASDTDPFMYHCHMANHEDGGLMGQFLVVKDPASLRRGTPRGRSSSATAPEHPLTSGDDCCRRSARRRRPRRFPDHRPHRPDAHPGVVDGEKPLALFFIERDCPCSADASPFFDRLQAEYGDTCTVLGVINADPEVARELGEKGRHAFPAHRRSRSDDH